jgi:hypothetical protein
LADAIATATATAFFLRRNHCPANAHVPMKGRSRGRVLKGAGEEVDHEQGVGGSEAEC